MVSLKDFAREYGVTYEAVRQQVKRYAAELDGHIHQQGRTQYLDDVAVAFLAEHRAKPATAIYDAASDPRIQSLEEQLAGLRKLVADLGQSNAKLSEMNAELTQYKLEAMAQQRQLEAHQEELDAREQKMAQELTEARQKAVEATREELDKEWSEKLSEAVREAEERLLSKGVWGFLQEKRRQRRE